jgi:GNAT superfamily N-acetyltransferase
MSDSARKLTSADVPAAATALARALLDDPGWIYTFPDATTRLARMDKLLAIAIRALYLHRDECWTLEQDGGGLAGAALWEPPGDHDVPIGRALLALPRIAWILGRRIPVGVDIVRQMEKRHPTEPHWYLAILGIDPAFQGRGLGPRLLAPVLDRADADGLLCWLESANPKNHGFYRRLGFEVADVHRFTDEFSLTFFARQPR